MRKIDRPRVGHSQGYRGDLLGHSQRHDRKRQQHSGLAVQPLPVLGGFERPCGERADVVLPAPAVTLSAQR